MSAFVLGLLFFLCLLVLGIFLGISIELIGVKYGQKYGILSWFGIVITVISLVHIINLRQKRSENKLIEQSADQAATDCMSGIYEYEIITDSVLVKRDSL